MSNNPNKPAEHRSMSYYSREDHNQFLEELARSNTNEHQLRLHHEDKQSRHKEYGNGEPKLGRSKCVFLVDHNRSIRQILRQMREKQKRYQERIAERQRLIREDRQYQRMASQFNIVERRVKNRLAIQRKRLQRQQSQTIAAIDNSPPKVGNNSELLHTEKMSINLQDKQKLEKSKNQKPIIESQPMQKEASLQHSQFLKNKSININVDLSQTKLDKKRKIKTEIEVTKSRASHIQLSKKLRPKVKSRNYTLPVEPLNHQTSKKIDYLKKMPRRHNQEGSLQRQLQALYNNESSDIDRVASLVDKIEQRRRLRLKNMEEKDYKSVESKLKLLNFLYKH